MIAISLLASLVDSDFELSLINVIIIKINYNKLQKTISGCTSRLLSSNARYFFNNNFYSLIIENSLEGFLAAMYGGIDYIELDV